MQGRGRIKHTINILRDAGYRSLTRPFLDPRSVGPINGHLSVRNPSVRFCTPKGIGAIHLSPSVHAYVSFVTQS